MVRLCSRACLGLLALSLVGCSGRSENVGPASGGAGAAASGAGVGGTSTGGSGDAGEGASGTTGGASATGGTDATGGTSTTGGAGGASGSANATGGAIGMSGGATATGGVAGMDGMDGGAGAMGGAGASGAAAGPAWLPTGALGPNADLLIAAVTAYTTEVCRAGLCALGATDPSDIESCVQAEFYTFAPSVQWLACAVRVTDGGAPLAPIASGFEGCAAAQGECEVAPCSELDIPTFPECPTWRVSPPICPTGETYYILCDGETNCADGYDERNCDPTAGEYECGSGETVAWSAVCDGEALCADEEDEFGCTPAGT